MYFFSETKSWTWNSERNGSKSSNTRAKYHHILCIKLIVARSVMMLQPIIGIEGEVWNSNLMKIVCLLDAMRSSIGDKMKWQDTDYWYKAKAENQIKISMPPSTSTGLMENGVYPLSYVITCMSQHPCFCPFLFSFNKYKVLFLGPGEVHNHSSKWSLWSNLVVTHKTNE